MRMLWADDDGNPVDGSPVRWLDPLIIVTAFFEAIFRAFTNLFGGFSRLMMQQYNEDVHTHNALELAAIELETVYVTGGDDDEDFEEDED